MAKIHRKKLELDNSQSNQQDIENQYSTGIITGISSISINKKSIENAIEGWHFRNSFDEDKQANFFTLNTKTIPENAVRLLIVGNHSMGKTMTLPIEAAGITSIGKIGITKKAAEVATIVDELIEADFTIESDSTVMIISAGKKIEASPVVNEEVEKGYEDRTTFINWKKKYAIPTFKIKHTHEGKVMAVKVNKKEYPVIEVNPLPFLKINTINAFSDLTTSPIIHYSKKSQKWKGIVVAIEENEFTAKLEDLDVEENTTYEMAEFPKEEVSPSDMSLLSIGAVFYWSVGYEMRNGQISKQSIVRFQRVPNLTKNEIKEVKDRAKSLLDNISWD